MESGEFVLSCAQDAEQGVPAFGVGTRGQIPRPDIATSPLRGEGALSCPRATNR